MSPEDPQWHSLVQAPLHVSTADEVRWDHIVDFAVVGFGGAGATAALRAAEGGLSVIALDRADGGGATLASGGVVYAGGGTSVQRALGETDTPENMYAYLKLETAGVVRDATLMRFCRESPAQLDWLMGHGVRFGGPVWKQKTSYPNVDYFLYHSDNSLLSDYAAHAAPAARGHRGVMRKGRSAVNLGGAIYLPLAARCRELGVSLLRKTEARRLIVGADGTVLGLEALQIPSGSPAYLEHQRCLRKGELLAKLYPFFLPGARYVQRRARRYFARAAEIEETARVPVRIRAGRGVCLSTGGFIFNRAMVRAYCPEFAAGVPLGTPGDDGAGIRLGQSVGGAVAHMDRATAWRFINPPLAWSQGVIVDAAGARFVNESSYGATIGDAMVRKAAGRGWLILDGALVRDAWRQISPTRVLPFQWQLGALNMLFGKRKFSDLESLCTAYGFDSATLVATLEEARRVAEGEIGDPFGRDPADARALTFPLHVIDVSLAARLLPCTVLTVGGLRVNEDNGRVLDGESREIPGLYAAGRTAVGIPSHLYMSGLSIADCVFSGLRAADDAVAQAG
jgi:3-oxo-5alpha-steroid 4-dehydrogenase